MKDSAAIALAKQIKKELTSKGVWCKVTEIHEPDLKFVKIEASIKVDKENCMKK